MKRFWPLVLMVILAGYSIPQSVSAQGFLIPLGNASAEDGVASPDGSTVVAVPQWTTTGSLTVVPYSPPGPFLTHEGIDEGNQYFCGGPDSALSTATQVVAIPEEVWPYLDSNFPFRAEAILAGWESNEASPKVEITLLDADMIEVCKLILGPLTRSDRKDQTLAVIAFDYCRAPRGARFVRVTLEMRGVSGAYNAAFIDDVKCEVWIPDPVRSTTWGAIKASRVTGR